MDKYKTKSISAATATGAGSALVLPKLAKSVTVQVVGTGTSITALTIDLEGSLDGVTYFQIAQHALTAGEVSAKSAMFIVTDVNCDFVRANATTVTVTSLTFDVVLATNLEA